MPTSVAPATPISLTPVTLTSAAPATSIPTDSWIDNGPWSIGRQQVHRRREAQIRWQQPRRSEQHRATPLQPTQGISTQSQDQPDTSDELTRALQEALAEPIPRSNDKTGSGELPAHQTPPGNTPTWNDNYRHSTRNDPPYYLLRTPTIPASRPPYQTPFFEPIWARFRATTTALTADPLRWNQWAVQQHQRAQRHYVEGKGRTTPGIARDDTLYPGGAADPAPWASLPSYDGILRPLPSMVTTPPPSSLHGQRSSMLDNPEMQELIPHDRRLITIHFNDANTLLTKPPRARESRHH